MPSASKAELTQAKFDELLKQSFPSGLIIDYNTSKDCVVNSTSLRWSIDAIHVKGKEVSKEKFIKFIITDNFKPIMRFESGLTIVEPKPIVEIIEPIEPKAGKTPAPYKTMRFAEFVENHHQFGLTGFSSEVAAEIEMICKRSDNRTKRLDAFGIAPTRAFLLYGPPGNGKTTVVKLVQEYLDIEDDLFFSIAGSDLLNCLVGESEKAIRSLFKNARKAAKKKNRLAIIFIDEVDGIAQKRDTSNSHHDASRIAALLTQMDGLKTKVKKGNVLVIAATNKSDRIDEAFKREGRFKMIKIDNPKKLARKALFTKYLNKPLPRFGNDVNVDVLTRISKGLSGADISGVVNESKKVACQRIDHIENDDEALKHPDGFVKMDDLVLQIKRVREEKGLRNEEPQAENSQVLQAQALARYLATDPLQIVLTRKEKR